MEATSGFVLSMLKAAFAVSPIAVDASATYQFNPSISQVEACTRAEEIAKARALQKALGQSFGVDSTMSCKEGEQHQCESIQNVYENTRGYIDSVDRRTERVEGWNCTVDLSVRVKPIKQFPKAIQAQAYMDRVVYTNNDQIKVTVETSKRGQVQVFKYDPVNDVATKVFPLSDTTSRWTFNGKPLTVSIPGDQFQQREAPYYLLVTVSGGPLSTLSKYRLHEFYEMYDNIPYADVTYIRKSFYVSRSKL